jgi:uncharacterized membrane protein YfcA
MITIVAGVNLALGAIFSMLGLGGAMLYIPVFHWFGYDFKSVAIPTGLMLNGITTLSAAIYYLSARVVDVKSAIPLIILSSFLGAPIGAYFSRFLPTRTLIVLFALAMIFAGGRMLMVSGRPDREAMIAPKLRLGLMTIGVFFIGFVAGLLEAGGRVLARSDGDDHGLQDQEGGRHERFRRDLYLLFRFRRAFGGKGIITGP